MENNFVYFLHAWGQREGTLRMSGGRALVKNLFILDDAGDVSQLGSHGLYIYIYIYVTQFIVVKMQQRGEGDMCNS